MSVMSARDKLARKYFARYTPFLPRLWWAYWHLPAHTAFGLFNIHAYFLRFWSRLADYGSAGYRFNSYWVHHFLQGILPFPL